MAKHSEGLKLEVVREYLSGRCGTKTLAHRYGLHHETVRCWIAAYKQHGVGGLRPKYSYYDAQFKHSVLECMQREELSIAQVAARFNIRSTRCVREWERQYHEGGIDALAPRRRGRPPTMPAAEPPKTTEEAAPDTRTREQLLKENESLRAEVAYLKKFDALLKAKKRAAQKKKRK